MLKFIKVTTDTGPKNIISIDFLQFQHPVFCYFIDEIRELSSNATIKYRSYKVIPFLKSACIHLESFLSDSMNIAKATQT